MTFKEKKYLNVVKLKTLKLKQNGQIPYSLYIEIIELNYDSDIQSVCTLVNLTEKYLRVGGFYIRHPEQSLDCDKEVEEYRKSIKK